MLRLCRAFAVDQLCDETFVSRVSSVGMLDAAEPLFETMGINDAAAQPVDSPFKSPAAVQLSDLFSADSPPPAQLAYRTPLSSPETLYRSNPLVDFSDTSDDEVGALVRRRGSPSAAVPETGRSTPLFAPLGSDTEDQVQEASRFGTPEGSNRSRSVSPFIKESDGELDAEQPEWMERYYDESEGSLRDFIVDDDDDDDENLDSDDDIGDSDDEEVIRTVSQMGDAALDQVRQRNRPRCSYPADSQSEASFSDPAWDDDSVVEGDEDAEHEAVIEWSPGPSRPRKRDPLLDFEALTLSDSDEISAGPSDTSPRTKWNNMRPHRREIKTGAKKPSARAWAAERVELADEIFRDLDKRVFDRQLGSEGAGAKIEWSKRLLTTAGTASEPRCVRQGSDVPEMRSLTPAQSQAERWFDETGAQDHALREGMHGEG